MVTKKESLRNSNIMKQLGKAAAEKRNKIFLSCYGKPKGKTLNTVIFDDIEKQVANQEHYTQFPIQVMEFCHVNSLSWCAANVVKYVCREGKKDGVKDLYKAMDYLKCLINFKETGVFLPPNKLAEVNKK